MTGKFFVATVVTLSISAPAMAQDAKIDLDGDGMYSYPELLEVLPELSEDDYIVMDVNGDGLLNADEIAAATEAGLLPEMEG